MTIEESKRRLQPLACSEWILRLDVPLAPQVNLVRPPPCSAWWAQLEGHCLTPGSSCALSQSMEPLQPGTPPPHDDPFPDIPYSEFPARGVWVVGPMLGVLGRCNRQVMRDRKPRWADGAKKAAGGSPPAPRACLAPDSPAAVLFQDPIPKGLIGGSWQPGRGQPCCPAQVGAAAEGSRAERRWEAWESHRSVIPTPVPISVVLKSVERLITWRGEGLRHSCCGICKQNQPFN